LKESRDNFTEKKERWGKGLHKKKNKKHKKQTEPLALLPKQKKTKGEQLLS